MKDRMLTEFKEELIKSIATRLLSFAMVIIMIAYMISMTIARLAVSRCCILFRKKY